MESGRAALLALGEAPTRYSLILTDVAMPDVNGLDVLRYVRSQPALHALPVVMMSAHENAGTGAWPGLLLATHAWRQGFGVTDACLVLAACFASFRVHPARR